MSELQLALFASMGLLGFVCGMTSLALTFIRRPEHPDLTKLRSEFLDLYDKVEHWRKRDSVRNARSGLPQQPAPPPALAELPPHERKKYLRRLMSGGAVSRDEETAA